MEFNKMTSKLNLRKLFNGIRPLAWACQHPNSMSLPNQTETSKSNVPSLIGLKDHTWASKEEEIWIFGYGSLIWKTNFPYSKKKVGYIKEYARRFWQGSTDHRGIPGKPGRVVTLVKQSQAVTWGVAYQVQPSHVSEVMAYLNHREKGGYSLHHELFYPKESSESPWNIYVYIGTQDNEEFLGDAPLEVIAKQIALSHGPSGANSEYLFQLADSLRDLGLNTVNDRHLFELDKKVKRILINNKQLSTINDDVYLTDSRDLDADNIEINDTSNSPE